jgi:hypothetical protein
MLLIKVRYYAALANIHYIKGSYKDAKHSIDEALKICTDESNYTYET